MGSSILSEVDDTSILRTGLSTCYWHPLDWLPASRLLPPRSGLERSDFVPWPLASLPEQADNFRFLGYSGLVVLAARFTSLTQAKVAAQQPNALSPGEFAQ